MFERNRIENPLHKRDKSLPVELVLDDGRVVKGKLHLSSARQIFDELNADGGFLDFETYDGTRELISKRALRSVRPCDVPRAAALRKDAAQDDFNPYSVLKLPEGADWPAVREAYHRLSKLYHPDKYSTVDLPLEISEYLDAMARRLNAAYRALEQPFQVKREINRAKTEPIYQRG